MHADAPELRISWMAEKAILCQTAGGRLDLALQERFWSLAEEVRGLAFVTEVVPGMNNLLVLIDPFAVEGEVAVGEIERCWGRAGRRSAPGKVIEIPVRYGGAAGVDLAHVAAVAGMSAEDYVRRHSAGRYTVFALGSQPGFGYLGGLDPALAVPRRDVPRLRVESGSVVIGGAQAGVISKTSPSGWHIIGSTSMAFFDPQSPTPALLAPGDTIRFVVESLAP